MLAFHDKVVDSFLFSTIDWDKRFFESSSPILSYMAQIYLTNQLQIQLQTIISVVFFSDILF